MLHAYRMFERILKDFTLLQVVEFDEVALDQYNHLRAMKIRIGTTDHRIAGRPVVRLHIALRESKRLQEGPWASRRGLVTVEAAL